MIQAKKEADEAFKTEEIQDAAEDLKVLFDNLTTLDFQDAEMQVRAFGEALRLQIPYLEEQQLQVLAAGGAIKQWAADMNLPISAAIDLDREMANLARTQLACSPCERGSRHR